LIRGEMAKELPLYMFYDDDGSDLEYYYVDANTRQVRKAVKDWLDSISSNDNLFDFLSQRFETRNIKLRAQIYLSDPLNII
jgi:hypothetical protein